MESASNSSDQTKPEPIADGGKSVGTVVVVVVVEIDVVGAGRSGGVLARFADDDFEETDLINGEAVVGGVCVDFVGAFEVFEVFEVFEAFVAAPAP
jgi:hypothetical protein